MNLNWKEKNVNIPTVLEKVKTLSDKVTGVTVREECLEINFSENPSQEEKEKIQEYWEGIDENSKEILNYYSREEINTKIKEVKENLVTKAVTKWTETERKIFMNLPVTEEELFK